MIKGLMITPPVIGRISIGKVVEKNGKRLPEKDDEFTITTQVQQRGQWVLHPLDEALRQSQPDAFTVGGIKEGAEPSDSQSESIPARSAKRTLKDKMGLQVKRLQKLALHDGSCAAFPCASCSMTLI